MSDPLQAQQLPPAVEGDTYNGKMSFANQLDSGETITSVAVTEYGSGTDLAITDETANAASMMVNERNVAIGKGVTFTVTGQLLATGEYTLQIVYDTSASQSKTRYAKFEVTRKREV